ncbi:apolipoprotein B-100 isoform X2 [Carassius gibelio]|uniref:apolipoprotein B-100 isoform X2 n=1 Tax=Carassius gibelio TaxID=101364 RepID=UPI0022795A3A|nr:apolipoprotein B-100 isoform X2 [Carassius gibelio]
MGHNELRLLLFLSAVALSNAQDEGPSCLMAKRYKAFNKYDYFYQTESLNALNEAVNGPEASCKVEIAVPGTCSYILRTTECKLREATGVTADGNPVFGASAGTEDFKTAMEKHPLKFTVEGDDQIKLFPEEGELINILNIKRGIISALAVPVLEEDGNKEMPSIYGLCKTDYVVKTRKDIDTEVTLNRDLSKCDKFRPIKDHTSPLALITGLHHSLAQLMWSNQTCNYKFDNEQHHMTSGSCTEKHVLVPFSFKGRNGVTNTGKQALNLVGVAEYNDKVFEHNVANMKPLHLDRSVDMSPIQDKDAALAVLRELSGLSKTNDGRKRAHLAHKLIAVIRKMEAETLRAIVPEALEISRFLTYQVLLQCGTPECNSAIMQIFRTFDRSSVEIDAAVYGMGMIPQSSRVLVKEMLAMARFKPTKPIYYALSQAVRRLYETDGVTNEIQAVADYALEQIGDCTGDQEHVFLSLRVIGNMVVALGAARPALHSAVIKCINHPTASISVQHAAIQVYRQITVPEEGREVLMHAVLDRDASVQKRVAAYLILMKNPTPAELAQLAAAVHVEENHQAKSFIISHITNILSSTAPETLDLRWKVREAFQGNEIGMIMEPTKLSQYYRLGSLEGNMIFESPNELPRELMLEMTLNAFGFDMDFFEIGMEGKGFEPIVEALFGDDGFFPDTVMKTTLYATDNMPAQLIEVLDNMLPIMRNERKKRQAIQNIVNEIRDNVNKLLENLKAQDSPEAMVYLRLLGAELGYLNAKDGKMIHDLLKMIPTDFAKRLLSSVDNELFLHYIFMDNEFYLPTGAGFPLRVALSGTFTPGIKGGLSFSPGTEFALTLSTGIEFVTEIGTHFPDYILSGLEMHTNIYHESGLRAKLSLTDNQLKLSIPVPREPTELISVTSSLVSVVGAMILPINATGEYFNAEVCAPVFPGWKHCTVLKYPVDAVPFLPLNSDMRFSVTLYPSVEVTEYTATISYTHEDDSDKVTLRIKAEGTPFEATNTVMLKRKQHTVSSELLIAPLQLYSKVSAKLKHDEKLTLELKSDLKLPETTSVQTLILKLENEKIEAELKSHVNSEIQRIIPNINATETIVDSFIDGQIAQSEKQFRDILAKSAAYLGVPALPVFAIPERLFLNVEISAHYLFGHPYYTITLPLPLGGKSTRDLNFPTSISTPNLIIPHLDLEIEAIGIILPEVSIPMSVLLSVPTLNMTEMSGKLSSNFYNLETALSVARDPSADLRYSAKFEVTGTSPVDLLSIKVEGSALVEPTSANSLMKKVKTVVRHKIFEATITAEEEVKLAEKLSVKSKSKLDVISHFGVQISVEHSGAFEVDNEEISGDGKLEGSFEAGSVNGSGVLTQSVSLLPSRQEAKIDSSLKVDSTLLQARNSFALAFANGGLIIQSNTTASDDHLTNTANITFKEFQLALNSHTKTQAFGLKIQNMVETRAGAEAVSAKIETSTDISEERIHSLIAGVFDINGLAIHSDASAKLMGHAAAHKANLNLNMDGLTTSGTTSLQSAFTMEELKQTFEINYKDLNVTARCKTIGNIMGTRIIQNTDIEMAGLSGRIKNHLRFDSMVLRVETNTYGTTIPFSFTFDGYANGDNDIYLYGHVNCDFNAKVLLEVEPQSFAHTHEFTISTLLDIDSVNIKSRFESQSDTLLIPSEQKTKVTVKAGVNNHAINQEINGYNTPARFGLEGSGTVQTNVLNTANTAYQDFRVSGSLKYDKSNDRHLISLPFIDGLLLLPDNIRITLASMGETLRNYINREGIASKIEILSQHLSDFVSNSNFESRAVQLKRTLITLFQDFALKLENLVDSRIDALVKLVRDLGNRFSEALELTENVVPKHISSSIVSITEKVKIFLSSITTRSYTKLNEIFHPAIALQIPPVSTALLMPSFGKLYGEVTFSSPVYNVRTSAEFKNASERHPLFTAFVHSKGTSQTHDILNYNLDSTAQISMPEMSPVTVSETLKLTHVYLTLDQQALSTLNGSSFNNASSSSFSLETLYKQQVKIPSQSLSGEVTLVQNAIAFQDGAEITLTVKNSGSSKFTLEDFSEEGTLKSDLHFNMGLSTAKLTFTGRTDSAHLQMKMKVNADAVALSHIEFNARVESESPFIENSLLVASGKACFSDLSIEIKAAHDTELVGPVSGVLSNTANIMTRPCTVDIHFQNKGNAKIKLYESLLTTVDLQNDYTFIFNPDLQEFSTVAVASFDHFNYSHKFTANNNEAEMGIYTVVNSVASFEFLNAAEMFVPTIFKIPAVKKLKLNHDQPIELNAEFIFQKSGFAFLLGNMVSNVSLKSSIVNISANTGIYPNDCLMHVSATTDSVFQELNSKLDGSTSLTTKSGLKLASSLSMENAHIESNHNSIVTLEDNFEAVLSVDTVAKIHTTGFTVNAAHQLSADTKVHPKAESNLTIKYTFNQSDSEAAGHGDAKNTLKLDATLSYFTFESVSQITSNSTSPDGVTMNGTLDNEANISVKGDGLKSSLKTTGNGCIGFTYSKLCFNIDDQLTVEGELDRMYSLLEINSNYTLIAGEDYDLAINHTAHGKTDLVPLSTIMAAVDIFLTQPSYTDFNVRYKDIIFSSDRFAFKIDSFSRWYNSSAVISVEHFNDLPSLPNLPDLPDLVVYECSYNLTSPSMLLEYQGGLHIIPVYHN